MTQISIWNILEFLVLVQGKNIVKTCIFIFGGQEKNTYAFGDPCKITVVCSGHAYIFILEKYSERTTYYSERSDYYIVRTDYYIVRTDYYIVGTD